MISLATLDSELNEDKRKISIGLGQRNYYID